MKPEGRIVGSFCKGLILAAVAGLVIAAISHDLDLFFGSPGRTGPYPTTLYGSHPMPGTGVAGIDFADIYTSAQALRHGESAYSPTNPAFADPAGRPKGYPLLMYWLYVPLSGLAFRSAFIVHTVFSLLALSGATVFLLWKGGLRRHIGLVLLAQASLYFLTPIGVTHFERGQFDLLVAAIIAFCFACAFVDRGIFVLAIATGVAGAIKWTSLPFIGCFPAFGFLLSSGRRRWAFFMLPWMTVLATAVFWFDLQEYWGSLRYADLNSGPYGVSMRYFLPSLPTKVLPMAMTLSLAILALIRGRSALQRSGLLRDTSGPLALVLTNLAICFPATSYEYHTVTALGMLPALAVWTEKASGVPAWLKAVTCAVYGTLLVVAFRIFDQVWAVIPLHMSSLYLKFSALLFGVCVYVVLAEKPAPAAVRNARDDVEVMLEGHHRQTLLQASQRTGKGARTSTWEEDQYVDQERPRARPM